MIIKNTSKSVIVFKAAGMPDLRLSPGYNRVKKEGIEDYFTSEAAKGNRKAYLSVTDENGLTAEEKAEARKAKEKNDLLNKAKRIVAVQKETLAKNDDMIQAQAAAIEELKKEVAKLKNKQKHR